MSLFNDPNDTEVTASLPNEAHSQQTLAGGLLSGDNFTEHVTSGNITSFRASSTNTLPGDPVLPASGTLFDEVIIPLAEEQLVVGKRLVETATIRLTTHAEERTELVEVPLTQVHWQVNHVPIDRVVDETPGVRVEGETTIYPVMEERLVVRRELVLREEVHVTRTSTTTLDQSTHTLLRETLTEERLPLTTNTVG